MEGKTSTWACPLTSGPRREHSFNTLNFLWTLGFCLLGVSLPLFLFIFNFVWHSVDRIVLNVNCWSTQQYFLSGSFQNLEIFLPGGASVFFPFKASAFGCWPLLPPAGRIGNLCWLDELLEAPATCWQHRESLLDLPIWGEGRCCACSFARSQREPWLGFPSCAGIVLFNGLMPRSSNFQEENLLPLEGLKQK